MKKLLIAVLLSRFMFPAVLSAESANEAMANKTATPLLRPYSPKLSVDFEVTGNEDTYDVVVKITNVSREALEVEHPGNRYALAFIVMNDLGNVIKPTGIAKVNQARRQDIILKAGETYEHKVRHTSREEVIFQFLTGSALFGYELEPATTYRIIAIYRPDAELGEGVCSREKVVKLE